MFYVSLMEMEKPKPTVNTQNINRKESKYTTTETRQIITKERKEVQRELQKLENNEQNSNSKFIAISNYFKCIWTKISNQKT